MPCGGSIEAFFFFFFFFFSLFSFFFLFLLLFFLGGAVQLNLWIRAFFFNYFNIQNLADFSKTLAKTLVEFTQEKQFCPKNFPNCFIDGKKKKKKKKNPKKLNH
jgi:hypothetical protein